MASVLQHRAPAIRVLVILIMAGLVAGQACSQETMDEARHDPYFHQRQAMVDKQIVNRGVSSPGVLAALRSVLRHEFVPEDQKPDAYTDGPLPIGLGQTISQPYIVALMTELARIDSAAKVLEVGTGSGYQAAVLAELADSVFSIEIVEPLCRRADSILSRLGYRNVEVRCGDGYRGWQEHAPFDAILVTAAPDHVPQPLIDQLKIGGRLIIPVGDRNQELIQITRSADGAVTKSVIPVRFVPMTGEAQAE